MIPFISFTKEKVVDTETGERKKLAYGVEVGIEKEEEE